jgi:fatty acid desaturase
MEYKIDWYRTPIDRNRLKQLTVRSDARGLLQSGSFLLIYAATVYLSSFFYARRAWIPMAAVSYLHCAFHGFVGMEAAVHELSHGTPFKSKLLNEFFYLLFSFLTWNSGVHFRASHMKHHQFTVHRGLDKEVVLESTGYGWADFLGWFTFDFKKFGMIVFPTIAHCVGNADRDFFFWDPLFPPGDERRTKMCNWARLVLIGHLILLGIFVYFRLWNMIAVVTFGYFIATFPSKACGIQQHQGLCPNVPDWRVCCHTVEFGPVMGYLYWHMNYHIEHHMFAAVPFYNLRALHDAIAFDSPEPPEGFMTGLKRVFAIKREQRRNPGYCFVPAFPPSAAPPRIPTRRQVST